MNNILPMKQFFAACALMLGIVSFGFAQEVVTGPSISLDKDIHDYGTIQQGANGTCEFTVTNSGTEPLILSRCKGSCGCTVPPVSYTHLTLPTNREV